jgi:uncharacterized protein (TIGR02145 family)
MAENLAYLPQVCPVNEKCGYWVYDYNGNDVAKAKATDNYKTYGVLYNFEAANTSCPAGWHLSSDDEWTSLERTLGVTGWMAVDMRGRLQKIAIKMKSKEAWQNNSNGTNESGFNALPAGGIGSSKEENSIYLKFSFYGQSQFTVFWTSTHNGKYVWLQKLLIGVDCLYRHEDSEFDVQVHSVRCIKD